MFLDLNKSRARRGVPAQASSTTACEKKGFNKDAWIHELTDSIIGDNYPVPDRMLVHVEKVVLDYLLKEMCDGRPPKGTLRPLRGRGRHRGDVLHLRLADAERPARRRATPIALFLPTFTPYIEICHLGALQLQDRADQRRRHARRRQRTPGTAPTRSLPSSPTGRSGWWRW